MRGGRRPAWRRVFRWAVPVVLLAPLAHCGIVLSESLYARLPELAADLPRNYPADMTEFDRRVRERFPIGTPEATLRRTLERQGFRPWDPAYGTNGQQQFGADYSRSGFPCDRLWRVTWRSEGGAVAEVKGIFGASCL